ncbi:peptidoglycan editing factor PgeF [bacterium]|nr:peptidoglycan editing factor PgeF [bacterium]
MIFQRYDQQWVGRFDTLLSESRLVHGFSTRKGGISSAPFDSLNLGINTFDDSKNVSINRRRFLHLLGVSEEQLICPKQIHGDRVAVINVQPEYSQTDAMITKTMNVALSIQVADCVPVFFYDPSVPCIGLAHAGWRGTAARITWKTVNTMVRSFKADPKSIRAFIGPSIGPCCYQVGKEVQPRFHSQYVFHDHLDLWGCNRDQCQEAGILDQHIQISGVCTRCNPEFFFSHRASGGKTGRMMAVIMLRE